MSLRKTQIVVAVVVVVVLPRHVLVENDLSLTNPQSMTM